ncbi:FAD-dependent monooxygenase [Streptosporangium soli]|nr:FAD-dependent monooxygenase [Streptosporangium sp. KLBMP 9127]
MGNTIGRGRALVVGLGIAGIATALRLRQVGWEPVLVERAAGRRSDGYFIMLFGAGVASARRLGVLEAIGDRSGSQVAYEVNRAGRRAPGMSPANLPGSPRQLLRGDIEKALFAALPDDVEIRYSTVPTHITQDDSAAEVALHDTVSDTTVTERYDLVVGADGMRSTVRRLAFGAEDYLHPLHYMIGATVLDKPIHGFRQEEGLILAEPGRSAWTFPTPTTPRACCSPTAPATSTPSSPARRSSPSAPPLAPSPPASCWKACSPRSNKPLTTCSTPSTR